MKQTSCKFDIDLRHYPQKISITNPQSLVLSRQKELGKSGLQL
jgi:hypothetical protein